MKLIILMLLSLISISCYEQKKAETPTNISFSEAVALAPSDDSDVSLVNLIANPEKYDGKIIQVIGYLNLEFKGNAIYLHKEDFDHGLTRNGFWVDFSEQIKSERNITDFSKNYVIIVGRFNMKSHGHMGLFGGTISNITRLDSWR